jgi:hypothetical protein
LSSLILSFLSSFFHPFLLSFFIYFSILSFRHQWKQISYINSCTSFIILIFVSIIFNLPSFSQSILTYIITFSIHSSRYPLKMSTCIIYSLLNNHAKF